MVTIFVYALGSTTTTIAVADRTVTGSIIDPVAPSKDAGQFTDPQKWDAFDPGDLGEGDDPDGYNGAAFDGRYIYYAPYRNEEYSYHCEVLRFDTASGYGFTSMKSWKTFDPASHGVCTAGGGYHGSVFDGRYVYFVPWGDNDGLHGEVLRFDTTGTFIDPSAWSAFEAGEHGIGVNPVGYVGGVSDGRYIYFSPYYDGEDNHGEVLRFDTSGGFTQLESWTTYDPGADGVGVDPDGYTGAIYDGRYIYFAPGDNGTDRHGEVLRYDTSGDFTLPGSWATYDPGLHEVGDDPDGYSGGVFDGRYVYFSPYHNGTAHHGEVLRYDTDGEFSTPSSWTTFDAKSHGLGSDPTGLHGAVFDGRYVYFSPVMNDAGIHDEFLRCDTFGDFSDVDSWNAFAPSDHQIGGEIGGYPGGVFDGRYIHFIPGGFVPPHGQVLRYDTGVDDCAADITGDDVVDVLDLLSVLGAWGQGGVAEDLTGDGIVDVLDLLEVLGAWGPCE